MIKPVDHFHGSDLEKIEQIYGIPKEEITSFSANVNPLGISPKLRTTLSSKIDAISTYPDREYTSLRKCIGSYVGTSYHNIIVGNGSTELISLLLQMKHPKKAMILAPTYSEYEREISLGGGSSVYYRLEESNDFQFDLNSLSNSITTDVDLLIICNPNNPTSSAIYRNDMKKILDLCKQKDIFVMVDETYVEFAEDMKDITAIPLTESYDNIIVLRGISKFFAAPGLRLGYAICGNSELINKINTVKNPWTINTLAAIAGEIMFADDDYINKTKNYINSERNRIYSILESCSSFKVYRPTANFFLVKILKDNITSKDLFDAAIKKGLMIRDCSTFASLNDKFIRFSVMEQRKNDELLDVLLNYLS